jgi:hypothetical protein
MSDLRDTLQKNPRKAKWCFWCGEACPPNEPRIESAWIFDGDFMTGHYHLECNTAWNQWCQKNRAMHEAPEPYEMQRGGLLTKEEEK